MSVWCVNATEPLLFHNWEDEEAVVYNPSTGGTHRVSEFALELLLRLNESPATRADLLRDIEQSVAVVDSENLGAVFQATLLQLRNAGLIVGPLS